MQNNKEDFRFPTFTSGWHAVYTGSEASGRPMHLVAKVKVNNEYDHQKEFAQKQRTMVNQQDHGVQLFPVVGWVAIFNGIVNKSICQWWTNVTNKPPRTKLNTCFVFSKKRTSNTIILVLNMAPVKSVLKRNIWAYLLLQMGNKYPMKCQTSVACAQINDEGWHRVFSSILHTHALEFTQWKNFKTFTLTR